MSIPVRPWYGDHHIGGRVVLPAVEILEILARTIRSSWLDAGVRTQRRAAFTRFLVIASPREKIAARVELHSRSTGVEASLQTVVQLKTMRRWLTHATVCFCREQQENNASVASFSIEPAGKHGNTFDRRVIYQEMVPFGPAYQTLEALRVNGSLATGRLVAPSFAKEAKETVLLGSPFPLDAAMHAACVLGQQQVHFIPFPVGFDCRRIYLATRPGAVYQVRVGFRGRHGQDLVFDLEIGQVSGKLNERITGLRMRQVE